MFQVKKTSQSKKLMRQLDKERRKKAKGIAVTDEDPSERGTSTGSELSNKPPLLGGKSASSGADIATATDGQQSVRNNISGKKIHTEIRTDDFVVRLLLSDTFSKPKSYGVWS